jgi:phosphopantothenoylcysteine synthetase/decarboxylase
VRRLTNASTGTTGGVIARELAGGGAEVLLVHAEGASPCNVPVERETFVTVTDLANALERILGEREWDAVIHLAAVGDYSVAAVEVDGRPLEATAAGKIASGHDLVIRLRPTPKLIDQLKRWSKNPHVVVVGFKLTNHPDPGVRARKVRALLDRGVADFVVHNDLGEISTDRHVATIHDREGVLVRTETRQQLARELERLLKDGGKQ